MKTVVFSPRAAKQLDALTADARTQILDDLARYAISGIGDIKKLAGSESFRLRSGRYRVVFDEDQTTVLAIYIGKRDTTTYR